MTQSRFFVLAAAALTLTAACTDRSAQVRDSTRVADSIKATIAPADTSPVIQPVDTTRTQHVAPSTTKPPVTPIPPSVTGETRRQPGAMVPPVTRNEDPMPPLTGETSKRGGTMKVLPPLRDSTRGPMMGFDSAGRPVPIKK